MKKFNINDNVYFKLTPKGIAHWRAEFEKYPVENYPFETHYNQYTKDGLTHMQMHRMFEVFGERVGAAYPLLFETNIFFNEHDLKDTE